MTSSRIAQCLVSIAKVLILVCAGAGVFCAVSAESARAETFDRAGVSGHASVGAEARLAPGLSDSSRPRGSKASLPSDTGDWPVDGESDGGDGGDGGDDVDGACFVPMGMHAEYAERDEIRWSRSTEERPHHVEFGALERPPRR